MTEDGHDVIEGEIIGPIIVREVFEVKNQRVEVAVDKRNFFVDAARKFEEMGKPEEATRLREKEQNTMMFLSTESFNKHLTQLGKDGINIVTNLASAFYVPDLGEGIGAVVINVPKLLKHKVRKDGLDEDILFESITDEGFHELYHVAESDDVVDKIRRQQKILGRFAGVLAGIGVALTAEMNLDTWKTLVQMFAVTTLTPMTLQSLGYLFRKGERDATEFGKDNKASESVSVEVTELVSETERNRDFIG